MAYLPVKPASSLFEGRTHIRFNGNYLFRVYSSFLRVVKAAGKIFPAALGLSAVRPPVPFEDFDTLVKAGGVLENPVVGCVGDFIHPDFRWCFDCRVTWRYMMPVPLLPSLEPIPSGAPTHLPSSLSGSIPRSLRNLWSSSVVSGGAIWSGGLTGCPGVGFPQRLQATTISSRASSFTILVKNRRQL